MENSFYICTYWQDNEKNYNSLKASSSWQVIKMANEIDIYTVKQKKYFSQLNV